MFEIETDIPLPTERGKYPFRDMEVGDSIFFANKQQATSARVASVRFGKSLQPSWTFTLRTTDKASDKAGWRLWRMA
jgi:hypothetical protein